MTANARGLQQAIVMAASGVSLDEFLAQAARRGEARRYASQMTQRQMLIDVELAAVRRGNRIAWMSAYEVGL
jgi:hypothetical protein